MKVLFTSPMIEYPPKSGPHLRIDNTIKALHQISDLHIISKVPKFLVGGDIAIDFYHKQSNKFSFSPSVKSLSSSKWVRRAQKVVKKLFVNDADYLVKYAKQHNIDAIWFGYGNLSHDLIEAVHKLNPGIPLICDTDSVWSRFIARELPFIESSSEKAKIQQAAEDKEKEEQKWVQWCDVTTAVSDVDAAYYQSYTADTTKVAVFPNAIDLDFYKTLEAPPPGFSDKAIILSGSFGKSTSAMNRAADWVLKDIWPRVVEEISDAHLYIVGTHSDVSYAQIHDPTITIAGRVPSILPYLQHAKMAITPLQFESGTRFKILEAGACKLPMVSTTLGAEGLDVKHMEHIWIADEAQDFADAIISLLKDRGLAKSMAEKSYELIKRDFGLRSLERRAKSILEQVV
tara:strand:- start:26172 stop:27374 length:1203 start_codon:yes stop_codon:yes gene_type:complete